MTAIERLNRLSVEEAQAALLRCCGSTNWAGRMTTLRPVAGADELFCLADEVWSDLTPADWLEAFSHHPRIGDMESLRSRFARTRGWSEGEQASADGASDEVLQALSEGNRAYEDRFGYIFIVCATGKSAEGMLALLNERLPNDPDTEIRIAAEQQRQITRLRLEKLLKESEAVYDE